jgi:glycosyltransferase involved in cell wall biosynthesis
MTPVPRPSLALCINTRNRPEGLARLLASVVPQVAKHPECKIVVVNDGSHDASYAEVMRRYETPVCIKPRMGIGSHLVAYLEPIYPHGARTYSTSGFNNRVAAHALLVTWAILDGKNVPKDVMDEYCVYKSRLRLRR